MDTKSKKSTVALSFLCFFLSIIILIGTLCAGLYVVFLHKEILREVDDAFQPDFQNTDIFRQTTGNQLLAILDQLSQGSSDEADSYWSLLNSDSGKNILYSAGTENNPAKFTNDVSGIDLNTDALPQGYNFKLYFDGTKVTITKGGKNINVYGDGTYRSNHGMWYVPGYSVNANFSNLKAENFRVTILVRKELIEPVSGYSLLAHIPANQRNVRVMVFVCSGTFLLGILLLILYILFRSYKKQADLALARFSGWFWFEVKVLCTGMLIYLDIPFLSSSWNSNGIIWGLCAVLSFFCYYLVINDIRYNHAFYRHNIFNSALKYYRWLEQGKPFQKQMVQRFWALLAAELLLLVIYLPTIVWGHMGSNLASYLFVFGVPVAMVYLIYRYVRRFSHTVRDIGLLTDQISLVKSGDFSTPFELPEGADMGQAARELSEIRSGIQTAVEEQVKSERLKIDLITNVSHDIKTPLTSIIGYVDLLKQEKELPEHVKDYVQILSEKSDRLKNMVQDIFDISKATSGNIELKQEELDLGKLIRQTMADMNEEIDGSGLAFKVDIPEKPVMIYADGQRIYRVFQNLLNNALQYSLENSRVFLTLSIQNGMAKATIKNTSKCELNNQNDLTERFVRGDSSRSTGGSGLGLSIARSFTEACGGHFRIGIDADLFTAEIEFKQIIIE